MNVDELRKQLIEWLNNVKQWYGSSEQDWSDYIMTDREQWKYRNPHKMIPDDFDDREGHLNVTIWTNDHEYHIYASSTHLGCIASTRKPRAGETWTRGNDLPDGAFSKKTFDSIIRKIAGYEIVAKVKPPADSPDVAVSATKES